jgi:hypothetical protein
VVTYYAGGWLAKAARAATTMLDKRKRVDIRSCTNRIPRWLGGPIGWDCLMFQNESARVFSRGKQNNQEAQIADKDLAVILRQPTSVCAVDPSTNETPDDSRCLLTQSRSYSMTGETNAGTREPSLTRIPERRWGDTEGLLAVGVCFDSRRVAEVGGNAVAMESTVEDSLELDADVDAHCDDNGEKQQYAAEKMMSKHCTGRRRRGERKGLKGLDSRLQLKSGNRSVEEAFWLRGLR